MRHFAEAMQLFVAVRRRRSARRKRHSPQTAGRVGRARSHRVEWLEQRTLLSIAGAELGQDLSLYPSESEYLTHFTRVDDHYSDSLGNEFFVDPPPLEKLDSAKSPLISEGTGAKSLPFGLLQETFELHSNPDATKVIFLDFDGHVTSETAWNAGEDIITPPYTHDDDTTTFTESELYSIQRIWERVGEDFLPFNVDVTTEDPGVEALRKGRPDDQQWGIRVAIGGSSDDWLGMSAGGVAYIGSFDWDSDTPCFVFNMGEGAVAEASSHEVGHTLGLVHDSTSVEEYYGGHGSGPTGWAPIMGVGYYQSLVQWSKGEYPDATNQEDDLHIITNYFGFDYRVDDHADMPEEASELNTDEVFTVFDEGIIEQNTDLDFFSFTISEQSIHLSIEPFYRSPNLDILANVYNDSGEVIASSNPVEQLYAGFNLNLSGGTYYLSVEGTGKDPLETAYSDYGSLGYYSITGTLDDRSVPFFVEDMDTDPGWTCQGDWAWGVPTGEGGDEFGNPDPTAGFTGENVIGYNLSGDYSPYLDETWVTTSAIDATGYSQVTLSFARWLNVESSDYDHALVQVSNDNVNWATLWENPDLDITDAAWGLETYDISGMADDQPTVYLRWGMGPTDDSCEYSGWNIDDVVLRGTTPLGEIRGSKFHDLDGDGQWDDGEDGLEDWTIFLDSDGDGELAPEETSTTTDADGNFSLMGLQPGPYTVAEVLKDGWEQTFPLTEAPRGELTYAQFLWDGQDGVDGLDSARAVAVSGDGSHLYATGAEDDALVVFSRDTDTGQLSLVEVIKDGQGEVDGLGYARAVTVSGDGSHVYAAGFDDDAVAVFSRDGGSGELTFVQVLKDGEAEIDGLDGAHAVLVSPGGEHVYVAGAEDDAVAVFSRDGGTGELTFVQVLKDGQDDVNGLDYARSLAIDPDGSYVYVASFLDHAVAVFSRDGDTGELSPVQVVRDGDGVDGLNAASSVTLSPDGDHLYAAGMWDNAVAVFTRDATTGELSFVQVIRDGDDEVDGLAGARSVVVSPDGGHLYATGAVDNAVAVFSRDGSSGVLSFVQVLKDGEEGVDGLDSAISVIVSPSGSHAYATGAGDDAVAVFSRDGSTGELGFVEVLWDGQGGVDGTDHATATAVSGDGKHVYVASYENHALAVFALDELTGALSFVQKITDGEGDVDGLARASSVTVSPDGSHVYATSEIDDAVAVFARDAITGELTFVQVLIDGEDGVDGLNGASSVLVNPDGLYVYVTGSVENALAVFTRNAVTGELTFMQALRDGQDGVDGLDGARSMAISPGGNHLYVAGTGDDALAIFSHHPLDGYLELVGTVVDTPAWTEGEGYVTSVAVSGDGKHVYLVGEDNDALTLFVRDISTGELQFSQMITDGKGIVDGLDGASSVVVSPDGQYVYVAGANDDAVAVFIRDPQSGQLWFTQTFQNGFDGVEGLDGVCCVTVGPDGNHVYAASTFDDGLVMFNRQDGRAGAHQVVLNVGQILTGIVFGNKALPGEARGKKFFDLDGSGEWNEGEPGLQGWQIYADLNENRQWDEGEPDAWTDAEGNYVLGGLLPGNYTIAESQQTPWEQTFPGRLPATGKLTFKQVLWDGLDGVDGLDFAHAVASSGDGEFLYATAANDNALAVFDRDESTGLLSFVEVLADGQDGVDGLAGARSVAISPDGRHAYTAGSSDDAVAVFSRDAETGQLSFQQVLKDGVDEVDGLNGVSSVIVSGDGNHVYAASEWDDAVAVFRRDADTGQLSLVEVLENSQEEVDGLDGAYALGISGDGNHLYVASFYGDALAVFSRDATTGTLSFAQVLRDGEDEVDGLNGPRSVIVSPDGNHAYVAGQDDDALAVFSRDTATGLLTFQQVLKDGSDDVDGLDGAHCVALSLDGDHVYAAGRNDNALAVFSRDAASGELSLVEVINNGQNDVEGLDGASALLVTADGKHVYATSLFDDALTAFDRDSLGPRAYQLEFTPGTVIEEIDFGNYASISARYWDEQGEGNWGDIDEITGYSRWVDDGDLPQPTYPDNAFTSDVVRTDTVTAAANRQAYDLTIESGTLVVSDGATVSVTGNFEIAGSGAAYVSELSETNGLIATSGTASLAGVLTLQATDNLGDLSAEQWGFYCRTIIVATGGRNGTFDSEPAAGDHLGYGVFLTDEGPNGQGITYGSNDVLVDLFQAAPGDIDGDRDVDISDIMSILAYGKFGDGPSDATWIHGDFDGDQDVDISDITSVLAAGKFGVGPYVPPNIAVGGLSLSQAPKNGIASAHDAVLEQTVAQNTSRAGTPLGRAAWWFGMDPLDAQDRPAKKHRWAEKAVDNVLAADWR